MVRTRSGNRSDQVIATTTTETKAGKVTTADRSLLKGQPTTNQQEVALQEAGLPKSPRIQTTDRENKMAQAEKLSNPDYKDEFAQMTAAMSTLNKTLIEMSSGLTTRLDGLMERMDRADVNINQSNANTEKDRKLTNDKLQKLENLLVKSEVQGQKTNRKLKETEAKLAAAEYAKKQLLERINFIENKARVNNLIIDGCPEREDENLTQYILDLVNCLAKTQVNAKNVVATYRIGKKQTIQAGFATQVTMRPRAIKVIFESLQIRNEVYYARASLKSLQMYKRIYISDDVTLDTKKAREDYRSVAALARSLKVNVKVHDDGLIIEGKKYRLFEAETLPNKFSLKKAKSIEVNGAIYFHSEHSTMSNFCYSPMLIDDIVYLTAEHRLQYLKCVSSKNHELAERITLVPTALEAKRLGDTIRETPEWRLQRDQILEDILTEKFSQNKEMALELTQTEDKKLYEATVNMYYGIGANVHSREVRDGTHKGSNMLGVALEQIRTRLIKKANEMT